jgi:hypothetical protein
MARLAFIGGVMKNRMPGIQLFQYPLPPTVMLGE